MPRGRKKYAITPEIMEQAEKYASQGLTDEQIAGCLGISRETLYQRKNDSPDFADAIKNGKAQGIQKVANVIFEKAMEGNLTAAIFFLKCRAGWVEASAETSNDTTASENPLLPALRAATKHAWKKTG